MESIFSVSTQIFLRHSYAHLVYILPVTAFALKGRTSGAATRDSVIHKAKIYLLSGCSELNVYLQNSYVEVLTPSVMVLVGGSFGEQLLIDEVMRYSDCDGSNAFTSREED